MYLGPGLHTTRTNSHMRSECVIFIAQLLLELGTAWCQVAALHMTKTTDVSVVYKISSI